MNSLSIKTRLALLVGFMATATSNLVTDMARHIADASNQQSVASREVARNMEQLSGLIGENNASARGANESGAEMYQAARRLKAMIGRFEVV